MFVNQVVRMEMEVFFRLKDAEGRDDGSGFTFYDYIQRVLEHSSQRIG